MSSQPTSSVDRGVGSGGSRRAASLGRFRAGHSRQQAIQALMDEIRSVEAQDPNSSDLISPLKALGLMYREGGEPALASRLSDRRCTSCGSTMASIRSSRRR